MLNEVACKLLNFATSFQADFLVTKLPSRHHALINNGSPLPHILVLYMLL